MSIWPIFLVEIHVISSFVCFRSEEHTSELQSLRHLVCRRLLGKKKECSNPPSPQQWSALPSDADRITSSAIKMFSCLVLAKCGLRIHTNPNPAHWWRAARDDSC